MLQSLHKICRVKYGITDKFSVRYHISQGKKWQKNEPIGGNKLVFHPAGESNLTHIMPRWLNCEKSHPSLSSGFSRYGYLLLHCGYNASIHIILPTRKCFQKSLCNIGRNFVEIKL